MNGDEPDCAIAVSGGKDSHFQVHVMKEKMGNYHWKELMKSG